MLTLAVAQSSSDNSAIHISTSGFVDDVMFSRDGIDGPESKTTLCFVQFARWREGREVAVYNCRLIFYLST